ncbi:MAG: hypothetical protein QW035_03510 [Candidatus Anstonellales archaeon]
MEINKKMALLILIISLFVFLLTVLVIVYSIYSGGDEVPFLLKPFIVYHNEFMVLMGLVGVFSGVVIYSIMASSLKKQEIITQKSIDLLIKVLPDDERSIVMHLRGKKGMSTQSEISKILGSRLKAHRLVRKLSERGILLIDRYGKTNILRLAEEFSFHEEK